MKRYISLVLFAAISAVGLLGSVTEVTHVAAWDTPEPHVVAIDN